MRELEAFHPLVSNWFLERFAQPSEPQALGWPAIERGDHVLIAAPTGSGKTLAAFLHAINRLVVRGLEGQLEDRTRILYISPLKALANDVQRNLVEPLEEIRRRAGGEGVEVPEIRPLVRSGDTLPAERQRMIRRPPHILVTTPESVYILLTSRSGREMLRDVEKVIVDEIHALAGDKRGAHLLLSLERLEALTGRPFQRVGLSATQKPVGSVASFLCGQGRRAEIIDTGHAREMHVSVEVPSSDELGAVPSNEMWEEIYDRLARLIAGHRTTLVFVNTRRLAERVTHHLEERLGEGGVATHHGSLSREIRLRTEERLKNGKLRAVVATASLELGIDIGSVDLVCQIGSTRSIALALQRIGRSGHVRQAIPRGRIFATTRDELVECAALVRSLRRGELDALRIPQAPLDVLAQQIVAEASAREWSEIELFETFGRAHSYRGLPLGRFQELVAMLSEGISTRQGRRGAYLHRDRVNGKIRARRGARLAAITSGGAIPDRADYLVKADPEETLVGTVDEDFAIESMAGDIFLLGNTSWRIRRVESGLVRVEDAAGSAPTIPFWRGEAPGRTPELSASFSIVREQIIARGDGAQEWLQRECGLDEAGARQAARYVAAGWEALGALPTCRRIVAERFFDEAGGMQLVLHSPLGSRVNKAWGLALRKCFCRTFNFELQAAATDNGILISLSDQHSFPLDSVFSFVSSSSARRVLEQALLAIPLFAVRWRWNASRALAVLRFGRGRKVPPPLQRMRADDLLAAVFPEQAACLEHIQGDIEIPGHPLVAQTVEDCLTEAMDLEGFLEVIRGIEDAGTDCRSIDTREPSPFSHEILNANPYAFLDEAPLEERRARAVQTRRSLPEHADELGSLDGEAIEEVARQAWPAMGSRDEVHDALLSLGALTDEEMSREPEHRDRLVVEQRAGALEVAGARLWFATERLELMRRAYPGAAVTPQGVTALKEWSWDRDQELEPEEARRELVRSRLESTGPATASELSSALALSGDDVELALQALEAQGQILRGSFRPGSRDLEWCDRRLLSRIHRLTLGRLRREIEPVTPAQYTRFLFRWQRREQGTRLHGEAGLAAVLEQLQGFEAAVTAWEGSILKGRVCDYDPQLLDQLCLSGAVVWARVSIPPALEGGQEELDATPRGVRPSRIAPISFFQRAEMPRFLALRQAAGSVTLSHPAREVREQLEEWGACFFDDLARTTGRLPVEVEEALWELVAAGLATADGFGNLRTLIDPRRKQGRRRRGRVRLKSLGRSVGRWTLLRLPGNGDGARKPDNVELLATQLLRRWGVMFRDLLAREALTVPWRDLLAVYRRMEARGQVRGGRFVSGFVGEQFALPEALDSLRTLRRSQPTGEIVRISAADPLNLTGIVTPGPRVRPHPERVLFYRDGVPVEEHEYLVSRAGPEEGAVRQ